MSTLLRRHAAAGIASVYAASAPARPCIGCQGRGTLIGPAGVSMLCACQTMTVYMELNWLPSLPVYTPGGYDITEEVEDD